MPSFPSIDLFNLDFSKLELPDTERVAGFARDAAYVTIGLAVLSAQEAQKLAREVVSTVKNGVDQLRDALI